MGFLSSLQIPSLSACSLPRENGLTVTSTLRAGETPVFLEAPTAIGTAAGRWQHVGHGSDGSSCRQRCAPSAATRARPGVKISPDTQISTWIKAPTKYLPTLRDPAALAELLGQEEGAGPAGNTTRHSQPAHNQSCLESLITEGFESVPWTN